MKHFAKTLSLASLIVAGNLWAADAPVLDVDSEPSGETIGELVSTNIVDGHFNTFTTWYHLLDGKNFITGVNLVDSGSDISNIFDDEYLYCVVDGKLYSKSDATAPVDGAVVNESGVTVNGVTVEARFAEKFCPVRPDLGVTSRSDGNATNKWRSTWTSSYEPTVYFTCTVNNMTTTASSSSIVDSGDFQLEAGSVNGTWGFSGETGNIVSSYTFLAKTNGSYTTTTTLTPVGGTAVTLTEEYQRIEGGEYDGETLLANFAQSGTNGNGAIITDVYVNLRRSYARANEREGYVIYPIESVERRIPAIARVFEGEHAGRLVTIYDYRHNGGDIGGGNISLQMAYSDDNGATWSTPEYLKDAQGNAVSTYPEELAKSTGLWSEFQADNNQYWNAAFGDAAICADRESGKLLLMAVGGTKNFFDGRRDNPNQCVRWISDDGGDTWTEATRVTEDILQLFDGEPTYGLIDSQFIGSGRLMQSRYVKIGEYYRVYAVIASQNSGSNTRNFMLYSDDFGQNWAVLGGADQCPVDGGNGDECKAEELPDGTVVLAGRNRYGNRNFNLFRYTDVTRGEGKWIGHVKTDMGFGTINACNGEIMILPAVCNDDAQSCYLVLQSFPYGGGRNFVSIAYKGIKTGEDMVDADMFTSWEGRYRIADGSSTYSTMAWQANDKLAFFWEDKNEAGTYLDLDIEEITDGHYSYKADAHNQTAIRLTSELLAIRTAEDFNIEAKYVGHPVRNADLIYSTAESYFTEPKYNTYVKFNKLVYDSTVISVVENGGYRFISAHDGTYSFTNDKYLSASAERLTTTEDDADNIFTVIAAGDGKYKLLHNAQNKWVGNTPSTTETAIPMVDSEDEAGEYVIDSALTGHSNMTASAGLNSSYKSLHMNRSADVVIWTKSAGASQWYMELVDEPEGYTTPVFEEPEYDEYDFDYENNIPLSTGIELVDDKRLFTDEIYFDLQGRRVEKPGRGLYITNGGRKILIK